MTAPDHQPLCAMSRRLGLANGRGTVLCGRFVRTLCDSIGRRSPPDSDRDPAGKAGRAKISPDHDAVRKKRQNARMVAK